MASIAVSSNVPQARIASSIRKSQQGMPPFIIDPGGESDSRALKLSTCTGQHIRNERFIEKAPATLLASLEIDRKSNPAALRVSDPTATYNCMGLVFGSRRTCIDISELTFILKEDSYERVSKPGDVKTGDVVIYCKGGKPQHVGLVHTISPECSSGTFKTTVVSKWGYHAEYVHDIHDVPESYGSPQFFWTHRKAAL